MQPEIRALFEARKLSHLRKWGRPRCGARTVKGTPCPVLDSPVPDGYARWTGPLIAAALGDVDVQYAWRFCDITLLI